MVDSMITFVLDNEIVKWTQIVLAHIFLIGMCYYCWRQKRENKKCNYLEEYSISSVVLDYFNNKKMTDQVVFFLLLELIQKKIYVLEKRNGEYFLKWNKKEFFSLTNCGLQDYEEELVRFLNPLLLENNSEEKSIAIANLKEKSKTNIKLLKVKLNIYEKLKNSIFKEYGLIEKEKNSRLIVITIIIYYLLMFPSFQLKNLLIVLIYAVIGIVIGLFLKKKQFLNGKRLLVWILFYGTSFVLYPYLKTIMISFQGFPLWLQFFNPFLLFVICMIGTTSFYSLRQQKLFRTMEEMKQKLEKNLWSKEMITESQIREYYLVSEAFNISFHNIPRDRFDKQALSMLKEIKKIEKIFNNFSKLFYR